MKNFTTKIDLQKNFDDVKLDLVVDISYNASEDKANEIHMLTSRFVTRNIKEVKSLTKNTISMSLKEYLDECCNAQICDVDVSYFKLIEKENER